MSETKKAAKGETRIVLTMMREVLEMKRVTTPPLSGSDEAVRNYRDGRSAGLYEAIQVINDALEVKNR